LRTIPRPFVGGSLRLQLRNWPCFRHFRVSPFRTDSRLNGQVREHLLALKAQESQRTAVQSHVQGSPTGAEAQLNAAAQQLAASRNIPFAQAYVEAMKLHPELYQQYLAEKSALARAM
jgi:hypothetical protein